MRTIRKPAVAGLFYPADAAHCGAAVRKYLRVARSDAPVPKALLSPHAGFVYSGPIAASAYAPLAAAAPRITRVVLLGPSHRVPFAGLALSGAEAFATPLGEIPLDGTAAGRLERLPQVRLLDEAHAMEHSLEVQLPFLQAVVGDFRLVPLVVGDASSGDVAEVLDELWGGTETLLVVSSDLSHYHDYDSANRLDSETSAAITRLDATIGPERACGCRALNGLLRVARRRGLEARLLDLRNSGDTAGDRRRVVGYGAYAFYPAGDGA